MISDTLNSDVPQSTCALWFLAVNDIVSIFFETLFILLLCLISCAWFCMHAVLALQVSLRLSLCCYEWVSCPCFVLSDSRLLVPYFPITLRIALRVTWNLWSVFFPRLCWLEDIFHTRIEASSFELRASTLKLQATSFKLQASSLIIVWDLLILSASSEQRIWFVGQQNRNTFRSLCRDTSWAAFPKTTGRDTRR